jgi:signal transduction histidine kinase/DNA-binding response OmpR family regulator
MPSTPQPPEDSQLYAIYHTAYEGFWDMIDWVMRGHAQETRDGLPVVSTIRPAAVNGRHGVFRVLEVGPGRAPCPYLTRLMTHFGPIHLTCVEQESDAFEKPHWREWASDLAENGVTTIVVRPGEALPDGDGEPSSRVVLCPGSDIFRHSPRFPYDLILLNAAIHEIHKGPEGREKWITEAPLPAGLSAESLFDLSVADRFLSGLDQNPQDRQQDSLLDRLLGDGPAGRIGFRGLLFRRHLQALEAAVVSTDPRADGVLSALRINALSNRMQMIRLLCDRLFDLLHHEGDLLIGDHYFPSWMPMRHRIQNVKEARERLHDVHRDDADFFLDPSLILNAALMPSGRRYSRKKAWALYHEQGPVPQYWMKSGFRELLEPERQGIDYRDGRRYYLCRLRPYRGRFSEKNTLEDCLSEGATTKQRFVALRTSLNDDPSAAKEQLQFHLFDDAQQDRDGRFVGKAIFRSMIDELSNRIAKWRQAQGWAPCEIIEYWFSYESSLGKFQRMTFQPKSDEVPTQTGNDWKVQGGAGKRVFWRGGKYHEDNETWTTVAYNAWLASRKQTGSAEALGTQSLHNWFVNESPQVSDAMAQIFRISEEGLDPRPNCPIRSLTLYPSLEWIKDQHSNTPHETVLGEIEACRADGYPDHLYFELDGREDNAKRDWKARIANWCRRFGEILLDRNGDFVPRAKVLNPPFKKEHPHFESLFSAFLASSFGIPPQDWLAGCVQGWSGTALLEDAYKNVPAWIRDRYIAFAARDPSDKGGMRFPMFMTVLPITVPGANENVASLILFTTRPMEGALLNMLALVSSRIVAQVREIEQDAQMVEKAAAEERLIQQEKARATLEGMLEDLRQAQKKAETAARARDFFLAQVNHELRTPLNHVLGFSQLLETTELDEGQLLDLRRIIGAGKYLESLIDDILDYQKIIMGQIPINLEDFAAAPWIKEVVALMEPKVRDKGNRLVVSCAADLGGIRCDRKRLRQVLNNLLGNAAKFTTKGEITVTAQREREHNVDWLVVSVADTGKGMNDETLNKLFQPFAVGDRQDNPEGTGLGLAICKKLCEKMGGDIGVTSEIGKGSTFTFRLPAAGVSTDGRATTPRPGPRKSGPLPTIPDRPCTVLVIDDDPKVAELMKRFLESEGFAIHVAGSGVAGLEMVKTVRPDVITLDLKLPGIDGWGVLAALKNDAEVNDIPVVIVSIVDDSSRGMLLGASDYVTKPVEWDRLVGLLRKYRSESGGDILVVDDDSAWRDLCRRTLEQKGWNVSIAEDDETALRRLAEYRPSLILLDLSLPSMAGFKVLEAVRRNSVWKDVPIIVMTAKELTEDERRRLNGAVQGVLATRQRELNDLLGDVVREVSRYRRVPNQAEVKV